MCEIPVSYYPRLLSQKLFIYFFSVQQNKLFLSVLILSECQTRVCWRKIATYLEQNEAELADFQRFMAVGTVCRLLGGTLAFMNFTF